MAGGEAKLSQLQRDPARYARAHAIVLQERQEPDPEATRARRRAQKLSRHRRSDMHLQRACGHGEANSARHGCRGLPGHLL